MDLDKRIVEYANIIISDANGLLSVAKNLTEQQRHFVSRISAAAERLILANDQYLSQPLPTDSVVSQELLIVVVHDLRMPVALMLGYCDVLKQFEDISSWSEKEVATLHHIGEHISLIEEVLTEFSNRSE